MAPLKYIVNSSAMLRVLSREKPEVVLVVNPPVFAVLSAWVYCLFHKCAYVVDTHSGAFTAKRWSRLLWIYRFLSRRALMNILHNEPLELEVAQWGARATSLGDIFYQLETNQAYSLRHGFNAVFACAYSEDEPLEEVIEAARRMPSVNFYITGSLQRAPQKIIQKASENVIFTDFIPDRDYNALLQGSDVVLSLTASDCTMQNGAYEALALGRPIITSDSPVLRKAYPRGAVFVDNSVEGIVGAINTVRDNYPRYLGDIKSLQGEFKAQGEKKLLALLEILENWSQGRSPNGCSFC